MDEITTEERASQATEIKERYGDEIVNRCRDVYHEEATAIGVTLEYLDCGCLTLHGFDEDAALVGTRKVLGDRESCSIRHGKAGVSGNAIFKSVVWKDTQEEFDRKYGNEKRIEVATKLFPPPAE